MTVVMSAMFAGMAFKLPLGLPYYWVIVPVVVLAGSIPISPQGAGVIRDVNGQTITDGAGTPLPVPSTNNFLIWWDADLTRVEREGSVAILVVDRPGWIQANVDGFATIISPLVDKMREKRGAPSPFAEAIGSRVTGLELGGLLGFMSSKVLGQFDPFHAPHGRLLLVAPNIVHVERELEVDPHDFRLWVCLHEETHRTQFTAVPWLRDHLGGEIQSFLEETDVDPMTVLERVREAAQTLAGGRPEAEERAKRTGLESSRLTNDLHPGFASDKLLCGAAFRRAEGQIQGAGYGRSAFHRLRQRKGRHRQVDDCGPHRRRAGRRARCAVRPCRVARPRHAS